MSLATALDRLYQQHRRQFYGYALSIVNCPMQAEDAVHDAFVKLFALERRPLRLKSYAFRAVRNAAFDILRRQQRRAEEPYLPIEEPCFDDSPSLTSLESEEEISAALADLDHDEREVILMHLRADLKFREIARVLDRPLGTVVSWYRRGLDKLRLKLETQHERLGKTVAGPASAQSEPGTRREDSSAA